MEFESRKPKEGEKFDNLYLALTQLSEIAELCGNCKEQRIVVRIQEGSKGSRLSPNAFADYLSNVNTSPRLL